MTKPTRKIICKKCNRTIDAIILKQYTLPNKNKDSDSDPIFQKLKRKRHKKGLFSRQTCRGSNYIFTVRMGYTQSPQCQHR